jgi:MEDS: MEthanogen/methylotroph, DcmR Sensory domain
MTSSVKTAPAHQCLLHNGASPRQWSALAAVIRGELRQNHKCIYLDTLNRIAELRPFLEAAQIDVDKEVGQKRLLLSADQQHLVGGNFDPDRMIGAWDVAYQQALDQGYEGLWITGDSAWEMGPREDYSKLFQYEQRVEIFIRDHPNMSAICQYQVGTVSREAVRHGLLTHQSFFVTENLSMVNPYFIEPEFSIQAAAHPILLDAAIGRLCNLYSAG